MIWKLWLDDDAYNSYAIERHPPEGWIAAVSVNCAQTFIRNIGFPAEMSLDHDLGDNAPSGLDFCKWLYEVMPEGSPPPKWYVHSRNVGGGAENIRSYLTSWEKALTL